MRFFHRQNSNERKKGYTFLLNIGMLFVVMIAGIVSIWAYDTFSLHQKKERFIEESLEIFQRMHSKEDAEKYKNVYVVMLNDSNWVAFRMNHACCSGDGFDVVIAKDSLGKLWIDRKKNFCGYEGLAASLRQLNTQTLATFFDGCKHIGLNFILIEASRSAKSGGIE